MMWCGFVTVHMLLPNVLSNSESTISFDSHPRRPIPKLANYRPPLFLLVTQIATVSHSQSTKSTPPKYSPHLYSTPSSPTLSRNMQGLFKRLNSNLKCTGISDDGRFGNGEYAWDIAWWGVWRVLRRIYVEAKNVGCLQSLSPWSFCFNPFFWSRLSGLLRLQRDHHMWSLFRHRWTLPIASDPFFV